MEGYCGGPGAFGKVGAAEACHGTGSGGESVGDGRLSMIFILDYYRYQYIIIEGCYLKNVECIKCLKK